MRLLEQLRSSRREAAVRMQQIYDRAADEEARELTDEETSEIDDLRAAITSQDERIARMEDDMKRMGDHSGDNADRSADVLKGATGEQTQTRGASGGTQTATIQRPAEVPHDLWRGRRPVVNVTSEPRVYDGPQGMGRFLLDLAAVTTTFEPVLRSNMGNIPHERMQRHRREAEIEARARYPLAHDRATQMGDLGGIVNPGFSPENVSRSTQAYGVTMALMDNRPRPANVDSITMPTVTSDPTAATQTPGSAYHDTKIVTSGTKANFSVVGAKAEIDLQAIELGYMADDLLADRMLQGWVMAANGMVLYGDGTTNNQPYGLLRNSKATGGDRDDQFDSIAAKASSGQGPGTPTEYLDGLTDLKGKVFNAGKRRPDWYVVNDTVVTALEKARGTNGDFLIPPEAAWVQNMGGYGTLPAQEGMTPDLYWRRIPVYVDTMITDTNKDGTTAGTGGDQSWAISAVRDDLVLFNDGPQSFAYDQTLAANGRYLLIARGYIGFNPVWSPFGWRVLSGTVTKLA